MGRRGGWPGCEPHWTRPTHLGKEPNLTLTMARPGCEGRENMRGEERPLTFPSASESLELLLLLESEELPEPC